MARHHPDASERASAQRWCALARAQGRAHRPGFPGRQRLLAGVWRRHGYVREWGVEQIVRDARVSMIYEGTNEIQAIDLLVRKVLADGGQGLGMLLGTLPGVAPSAVASARRHALVEITHTLERGNPSRRGSEKLVRLRPAKM